MHHRVDLAVANNLRDERVADIGPDKLGPAHAAQQVLTRSDRIHCDHAIDHRILDQARSQVTPEESAGPGNQHDPRVMQVGLAGAHGRSLSIKAVVGIRSGCPLTQGLLAEFSALHAGATKQLAVLLLGHTLTPLLDD
ncbi:Uncharacterised protein [Mycobacteroides abscessus subsp. abscessus]|nr:Uncharacterised protein [Mycobacteroides abscessus subsp. abscessus]